jgi:hypothetical protein
VIDLEVNALLTKAALLDPRMKRTDRTEQADRAEIWAELLVDVELGDALVALTEHYRASKDPIMPADILAAVGYREPDDIPDITSEIIAASKARVLEEHGVTEAEFEANKGNLAWFEAHFPEIELTESQRAQMQKAIQ